jgi:hypothetical protein
MEIKGFTIVTKKGKLVETTDIPGYFSKVKNRLLNEIDLTKDERIVLATLIIEEE